MERRIWLTLVAAALALTATACGSSASGADRTTTGPPTTFRLHRFERLPKPTRTHPVGLRTDKGGVTVRSYETRNRTAADVIAFYARVLPQEGWTSVPAPNDAGSTNQATFRSGGYLLRVTAELAPTLGDGTPVTQFSLEVTRPGATP